MRKTLFLTLILCLCFSYKFSQSITVDSPTKGENWKLGTLKKIIWTTTSTTGKFKITLWLDGDQLGVIAKDIDPDKRTKLWEVGKLLLPLKIRPADLFQIKVKEQGTSTAGFSAIFKITMKVEENYQQ